jgi:hypothetical protein
MTLDECESIFAEVRSSTSFDEAKKTLRRLIVRDLYAIMSFDAGHSNILWRGRRCKGNGLPFATPADVSYPSPAESRVGRLNDKGAPCLYASTKKETVFAELDLQPGEYVQLLGLKAKPGVPLRFIAIGELVHVYQTGYMKMFGGDPGGALARLINSYDETTAHGMLYIDAFLGAVLSDVRGRDQDYRVSRAVAALAYETVPEAEGFYYPSVRTLVGTNVTMKTETYDRKFHAIASRLVHIRRRRLFGFYDHEVVSEALALSTDGTFIWQTPAHGREAFFDLLEEERTALARSRQGTK